MGLFSIDSKKPVSSGIGYAVRIKAEDGYLPAIKYSNYSYKINTEYTAEGKFCYIESREGHPNLQKFRERYPIGFHLFPSKQEARDFLKALVSYNYNNYVIVKCSYSEAHTSGLQGYYSFEGRVIVANKITILCEIE